LLFKDEINETCEMLKKKFIKCDEKEEGTITIDNLKSILFNTN